MRGYRIRRRLVTAVFCALLTAATAPLVSQEEPADITTDDIFDGSLPAIPEADEPSDFLAELLDVPRELPRGFGRMEFGMSRDEVGTLLVEDPNFNYRGDPDVQFLPRREQVVIDTAGFDFVSRGYFQFYDGGLYSIIIKLDTRQVDYFSMFSRLRQQYGHPDSLSPSGAIWEDGEVRLALERPLSVKYLDLGAFESIRGERQARESDRARALRNFIEQF